MQRLASVMIRLVWWILILLCAFVAGVVMVRVTVRLEAPAHLEIKPPQHFTTLAGPRA
jgi:hypothetical protein